MTTILQVSKLSKSFHKKVAVDSIDIFIKKGEAYGLLGPNGAGKSTTINMIAGLLEADDGEVMINSFSIKKQRKKAQMQIGVVPQEIALYPTMSAEANLKFFGKLYGLSGANLTKAVEQNLKLVGLFDRRKEPIDKYSGGMKRRINIAAALLHQPQLLIMDEPTVGIDPQSRSHILETVKKLQSEKGMSILYTTHYMEEVETICDRIGIIDNGKLIAEGTLKELKEKYGTEAQLDITLKQKEKIIPHLDNLQRQLEKPIKEHDDGIRIITTTPHEDLPAIMNIFQKIACEIRAINILEPNLETIFLSLTGKSLRDD